MGSVSQEEWESAFDEEGGEEIQVCWHCWSVADDTLKNPTKGKWAYSAHTGRWGVLCGCHGTSFCSVACSTQHQDGHQPHPCPDAVHTWLKAKDNHLKQNILLSQARVRQLHDDRQGQFKRKLDEAKGDDAFDDRDEVDGRKLWKKSADADSDPDEPSNQKDGAD